jgi:hypothetical protein
MDQDETLSHVNTVSVRVRAIAPADLREQLLRATETHETELVHGFGEVWRLDGDLSGYVTRHAGHLRELLLFELAHEGAATEAMRAAAAHGEFADEFAEWEAQLRTFSGSASS